MCRRAVVWLALATLGGASAARTQGVPRKDHGARGLLARAESLLADARRADSADRWRAQEQRRARRFDAGDVTLLLPGTVGRAAGRVVVASAAAYLNDLGAVPEVFLRRHVLVTLLATDVDVTLKTEGLLGRATIGIDLPLVPDTLVAGWSVAAAVVRAYEATLDRAWQDWLPTDLSLGWRVAADGPAAVRALMEGDTRAGAKCLEGEVARCRLWLGLDDDPDPFQARYEPGEIRHLVAQREWFYEPERADAEQCVAGSDDACLRFAEGTRFVPRIPAGAAARRSLLRAVRALHGPDALLRALADTSGSLGQRLARVARVPEDSMVAEWRSWVMTEGGQARVTAGVGDALPVLAFVGLLLLAATRGGRWR